MLQRRIRKIQVGVLSTLLSSPTCWRPWTISTTLLPRYKVCTSDGARDEDVEKHDGPIPRDKLTISFSRSSGPGGQNVNKLNTKAEVRLHVDSADWLPDRVKSRLKALFKSRLNKDGELIVVSQRHRSQHRNLADAILKLEGFVHEASEVPRGPSGLTVARIKLLKRRSERQRLIEKKYHSQKKAARTKDI